MYLCWWRIQNVYTKWDLALGVVASAPILFVILYAGSAYSSDYVVYLQRIVGSGPILASGSVPLLVWQSHRNGLKKQVKYCHKSGIQPLYNALYIDSHATPRRSSILSRVISTDFTAGEGFSIMHAGEDMKNDLQQRYQTDENWKKFRQARMIVRRYKAIYSKVIIKALEEMPNIAANYDRQLYQLALQIRNKAVELNVPENWWGALENYIRGKLKFQRETELKEHTIAANYIVSEIQAQAENVKRTKEDAQGVLKELCCNLRDYMIAMALEVPEELDYWERKAQVNVEEV